MDGRTDEVISLLAEKSVGLKVVAIVGGGGLGKTTLAMEAYRKIGEQFQCRASVSLSRTLDPEKLLEDILSQIDEAASSKYQSERWKKDQLIREIQRILTGKRYFFVIDDVWKEQHWEFVKAIFCDSYNGSRIIVTTRIIKVAKSACSNFGDQLYQMLHLNVADSKRLFFKRIFHLENTCPAQLEDVSARILKKCGGVPLAIITIASLLANKPQNPNEWERLQDSIGNGLSYESDDGGKGMRHILLLSYWDLPHHLKTCLLYLCIYPEDWYIPCEELKLKWISEGFIATIRGNLYQDAESYFNELVNRSLIQLVNADHGGYDYVQYCQVHDMVLDLIISLSDEENFATIFNGVCNSLPSKIHRISLQSSGHEQKRVIQAITRSKLHVRSLNVYGEPKQIPPLVDFQSLRVLDIGSFYQPWENMHIRNTGSFYQLRYLSMKSQRITKLPEHIGKLQKLEYIDLRHFWSWGNKNIRNIGSFYQLRYLRIQSEGITELPEDIGKLQNLETLDLRGSGIRELPSTTTRLQNLVRLFVDRHCVLSADMFGSMRALEEVADIDKIDSPEKFLEELEHLTKLRKITVTGVWTELYRERLRSSLKVLGNDSLQYLFTRGQIGECLFRDPCCTFPNLQNLVLVLPMMRVPKGMASMTNIIKLDIEVKLFDDEGLQILIAMPSLANLGLHIWASASVVTISSNGFKLLEVFNYTIETEKTTGIKFGVGAMPALQRLHLSWKAYRFPFSKSDGADMGLEHLSSLADLWTRISCYHATLDEVETLEGFIEKAIALHPNRHNLQLNLSRECEAMIYSNEERAEQEERRRREGDGL